MYEKIVSGVYKRPTLALCLRVADKILCLSIYALFTYIVIKSFLTDALTGVKVVLTCFVPFLAVSIIRNKINAPRPKKICNFNGAVPFGKTDCSFPSRHAFSAFCIATVSLCLNLHLGVAGLTVALAISIIRVLLGYHFVRDVLAGGIIGVVSAIIGTLLF